MARRADKEGKYTVDTERMPEPHDRGLDLVTTAAEVGVSPSTMRRVPQGKHRT